MLFQRMYIKLIVLFVLTVTSFIYAGDIIPYISPGIRIGWSIGNAITFGLKTSIGGLRNGSAYNVTVGGKFALYCYSKNRYYNHLICDIQYGRWLSADNTYHSSVLLGGGLGFGLGHKYSNQLEISPHASLFGGNGLFGTADFLIIPNKGIDKDIGLQGVLPIPLVKFDARGT